MTTGMWSALAIVLAGGPAWAQEEVCPGPLAAETWREAMDEAGQAIADFHGDRADRILDDIVYALRCLDRPADPADLGRLARQLSLLAFFEQDAAEAESWAILARRTAGDAPWEPSLPIPEAYRALLAELPPVEPVTVEDRGVLPPRRGGLLLDGWLLTTPTAELGTMHLLQVADKKGAVTRTLWQHGVAFPDELLGPPAEVQPPRWYVAPPEPPPPTPGGGLPPPDGIAALDPPEASTPEAAPTPSADGAEPLPSDAAPEPAEGDLGPAEPTGAEGVAEAAHPSPGAPGVHQARRGPPPELRSRMFGQRDPQEGCPWRKEPRSAEASGRTVRINRHTYPVRSPAEQQAFKKVLRSCGEFRAARRFTRWRQARHALSLQAGRYKEAMIRALLTPEPERRRRDPPAED